MRKASVLVLGDLGRSPRMCNHAVSLADSGFHVDLIGYGGSQLSSKVRNHKAITAHMLPPVPRKPSFLPRLIYYVFKVLWQMATLFTSLWRAAPDVLLVQNPPSVPTLPLCWLFCACTKVKLVVDWHNYGYTLLGLTIGAGNPLVRFSRWIERFFGRRADAAFCVTEAMRRDLRDAWGVSAVTLYDKAPDHFRPLSGKEKHELLLKLGATYSAFTSGTETETCFTEKTPSGNIRLREGRPGLVVSSTSWTEDEDFSILFDALAEYEASASSEDDLPALVCAVTGKGPLKDFYVDLLAQKEWKFVSVVTPWLEPDDYPKLLACADLGVSLHTSTSGLDLPMKVVDMFGCHLPVAALAFPALEELVQDGRNGMVFENSAELANKMKLWFRGFPAQRQENRQRYVDVIEKSQQIRWKDYWNTTALPCFETMFN